MPFLPQRVFIIDVADSLGERGGHANSCAEVIVPLRGSVTVDLDNGRESACIRLTGGDEPLWISAGVVIRLTAFEAGSLLLVCASEAYARTRHYAEPQEHLVTDGPGP